MGPWKGGRVIASVLVLSGKWDAGATGGCVVLFQTKHLSMTRSFMLLHLALHHLQSHDSSVTRVLSTRTHPDASQSFLLIMVT